MERQVKSRQRVADHGEVFTAQREVDAMCDLVKQETERIDSRFLEPACGDGNFLSVILKRKLTSMPRSTSLRKQATPTTKPSFPSPPATICSCPAHHSVPSTAVSLLRIRFVTGHIRTSSVQRRAGSAPAILICRCREWSC